MTRARRHHPPSVLAASLAASLAAALAAVAVAAVGPTASAATLTVDTVSELKAAVGAARPGDTIHLEPGTYTVSGLTLANSGTSSQPITLTGEGAVITTGSASKGYGIHVTGDYWRIRDVTVTKALKGIVADGASHLRIEYVTVTKIGQEGIHFRSHSDHGAVRLSTISYTGTKDPGYGEGIYVGSAQSLWKQFTGSSSTPDRSSYVLIEKNTIAYTPAEGIDIKEGTVGGTVRYNTFRHAGTSGIHAADSWVDVKGNSYALYGNRGTTTRLDAFQTHVQLSGWGRHNRFADNLVWGGVPGYTVRVAKGSTGTVVECTDLTTGRAGLANVTCVP